MNKKLFFSLILVFSVPSFAKITYKEAQTEVKRTFKQIEKAVQYNDIQTWFKLVNIMNNREFTRSMFNSLHRETRNGGKFKLLTLRSKNQTNTKLWYNYLMKSNNGQSYNSTHYRTYRNDVGLLFECKEFFNRAQGSYYSRSVSCFLTAIND